MRAALVALLAVALAAAGCVTSGTVTVTQTVTSGPASGNAQATTGANGQTASSSSPSSSSSSQSSVPAPYDRFTSNVQVSIQGDTVVLVTDGLPNHGSPYWPTSDPRYEADTDPGFKQAPGNVIGTQHLTLRIPLHPAKAPAAQASHLGPIGLALNGVPFFNAKNAQNQGIQPGQGESVSFDQYHGHPNPQPANMYHYHIEPSYLTGKLGKDALLGFLLDGYPVYGPLKDGKTLTDSDLQANHGLATADGFGFQYRITADYPYIMGDTFYGTPGTAQ